MTRWLFQSWVSARWLQVESCVAPRRAQLLQSRLYELFPLQEQCVSCLGTRPVSTVKINLRQLSPIVQACISPISSFPILLQSGRNSLVLYKVSSKDDASWVPNLSGVPSGLLSAFDWIISNVSKRARRQLEDECLYQHGTIYAGGWAGGTMRTGIRFKA